MQIKGEDDKSPEREKKGSVWNEEKITEDTIEQGDNFI